jgi:hypothetical protein
MQMKNKHNLVLCVDKDLVEKSHSLGLNFGEEFENHLRTVEKSYSVRYEQQFEDE